jgi:hypothetical protein
MALYEPFIKYDMNCPCGGKIRYVWLEVNEQ